MMRFVGRLEGGQFVCNPPAEMYEQVRLVWRGFVANSDEILKEAARIPGSNDQGVGIRQIDADNVRLIQKSSGQLASAIAGDKDRKRMIVQKITDLGDGSDGCSCG